MTELHLQPIKTKKTAKRCTLKQQLSKQHTFHTPQKYAHNVNVNMQAKLGVRLKQLVQLLHMVFVYTVIKFSKRSFLFKLQYLH